MCNALVLAKPVLLVAKREDLERRVEQLKDFVGTDFAQLGNEGLLHFLCHKRFVRDMLKMLASLRCAPLFPIQAWSCHIPASRFFDLIFPLTRFFDLIYSLPSRTAYFPLQHFVRTRLRAC